MTADRGGRGALPRGLARGHVSTFHIEAVRLGVASAAEAARIDAHLVACGACAALASAFAQHRRDHADAMGRARAAAQPAAAAAAAPPPTERRPDAPLGWWARLVAAALIPAAAGALLALALPRHGRAPAEPPEPEVIEKGATSGPALLLAARRAGRVFLVRPGQPLRAGDQVRFMLEGSRRLPFVLVASIDGAGHASVYVPYDGRTSAPSGFGAATGGDGSGGRLEIPGGIVLDDSPGPERIFALLSMRPLDAAPVRAALEAIGARGREAIRQAARLGVGADEELSALVEKAAPP